jgi:hypothetical protein
VTEYLPVAMSFMAAKNCVRALCDLFGSAILTYCAQDLMLFNLFADLQKHGILSKVKTGSRMF